MHASPSLGARKVVLEQLIVIPSFSYEQHGCLLIYIEPMCIEAHLEAHV